MKNILLLTDLSVQSLWPVKEIIKNHSGQEELVIHVIHMIEAPANIQDLMCLGRSKNNIPLPASFTDSFSALRNKYWGIFDFCIFLLLCKYQIESNLCNYHLSSRTIRPCNKHAPHSLESTGGIATILINFDSLRV